MPVGHSRVPHEVPDRKCRVCGEDALEKLYFDDLCQYHFDVVFFGVEEARKIHCKKDPSGADKA